jgi:hypothetical protein
MSPPRNHRARMESLVTEAMASRGEQVGFTVTLTRLTVQVPGGEQATFGWTVVVSLRHPEIGKGDLMVPSVVPSLTPDKALVRDVVAQSLEKLDDLANRIRREIMQAAGPPAR